MPTVQQLLPRFCAELEGLVGALRYAAEIHGAVGETILERRRALRVPQGDH